MTKVTPKQLQAIIEVLEESFKQIHSRVIYHDKLACILFPPDSVIPKDMTEMREELNFRGFFLFYSRWIYKGDPVFSVNVIKIK